MGAWRALLALYPRAAREIYGAELIETLEARLRAVRAERGRRAALRFYARNTLDLARGALAERRGSSATPPPVRSQPGGVGELLSDVARDVRLAVRRFAKSPGFTAVALLLLAIGIGANSTIFSVLNAVVLRPLPYDEPERLVQVWESNPAQGWDLFSFSHPNYLDQRDQNHTFEHLAAFTGESYNLTGLDEPLQLSAGRVTHDFFPTLGIEPLIGRGFSAEDDEPGGVGRVALLSYGTWQTRFGGDRGVVGDSLTLDGEPYEIVGVMPPGPLWLDRWELMTPLNPQPDRNRSDHRLGVIGRLAPDVTLEGAEADLDAVAARLAAQYPDSNQGFDTRLMSMHSSIVGEQTRTALYVLMAAVGFVLLIAAANLANLLLARSAGRRRELALSIALGSDRGRLVRQMTIESTLLAVLGGAAGLGLAEASVALFRSIDPGLVPRFDELGVDATIVVFTLALSVVTGVFAGLFPAWQATRGNLVSQVQGTGRGAGGASSERARRFLLIGEIAVSTVLLVGAGLLIRSFQQVNRVDPGLDTEHVLAASLTVPPTRFFDAPPSELDEAARDAADQRRATFFRQLLDEVRGLPEVEEAALISGLPFGGGATSMSLGVEGQAYEKGSAPQAYWRIVSPRYFETLGIPLLRGRSFTEGDDWRATPTVIVSQRMAERLWPGEDAVGKRFFPWEREEAPVEIVGVVGDVRERDLEQDEANIVYLPQGQALYWPTMYVVTRTAGEPAAAVGSVRAAVGRLAPDLPLANAEPLQALVDRSLAPRRFNTLLLLSFAATAILLAAIGIYGVMAYSVGQRRTEIGVRLAMGASPGRVRWMIVRQTLTVVAIGGALGLAGALALTRTLATLLYGVQPADPLSLLGACALVGLMALISSAIPAVRASRVAAWEALRTD